MVASEYTAKYYVVEDALRYNRTDTALVRVIVPMSKNTTIEEAYQESVRFVRASFQPLRSFFPA